MTRLIFVLGLLVLTSCGKKDNTTGEPPKRDIIYQRALELQSPLEDLRGHLIIKDKAMYRFAQDKDLKGSFSLGDDYRVSLKKTFVDKRSNEDAITIPYQIGRLALSSFEHITLTLRRFDFDQSEVESTIELLLQDVQGAITEEDRRLTGNLLLNTNTLEDDGSYSVGISRFVENGRDSQGHQRSLYEKNARIYIHTSQGEDVFYMAPGVSILAFLKGRFGNISLSQDGSLRVLGKDTAKFASKSELDDFHGDSNPNLWIQHPQELSEKSTFSAGEEYLFIHTSKEEIRSFLEESLEENQFQNDPRWSYWRGPPVESVEQVENASDTATPEISETADSKAVPVNDVVYKRSLGLQIQSFSSSKPKDNFKGHLVVKDKAVYKFARGLPLQGSFSFGDEYRVSLNSTYMDNRILKESQSHEIPISYKLTVLGDALISDVGLSLRHFNFETERLEESVTELLPVVLDDKSNEHLGDLSAKVDTFDTTKLNLIEISEFKENDTDSKELLQNLYNNEYARVYVSTSQGEEVFFVTSKTKIHDFLEREFGNVEFSPDGFLRTLGSDHAEYSFLKETTDTADKIWIQHPEKIKQFKTFLAGEEYIFIHTSRRDVLFHAFGHTVEKTEARYFDDEHTVELDAGSVYMANISLKKGNKFLEETREPIIVQLQTKIRREYKKTERRTFRACYTPNRATFCQDEHEDYKVKKRPRSTAEFHLFYHGKYKRERQQEEEFIPFSMQEMPDLTLGHFGASHVFDGEGRHSFLTEIVPNGGEDQTLEFRGTKKNELRTEKAGHMNVESTVPYHTGGPNNDTLNFERYSRFKLRPYFEDNKENCNHPPLSRRNVSVPADIREYLRASIHPDLSFLHKRFPDWEWKIFGKIEELEEFKIVQGDFRSYDATLGNSYSYRIELDRLLPLR